MLGSVRLCPGAAPSRSFLLRIDCRRPPDQATRRSRTRLAFPELAAGRRRRICPAALRSPAPRRRCASAVRERRGRSVTLLFGCARLGLARFGRWWQFRVLSELERPAPFARRFSRRGHVPPDSNHVQDLVCDQRTRADPDSVEACTGDISDNPRSPEDLQAYQNVRSERRRPSERRSRCNARQPSRSAVRAAILTMAAA